MQEIPINSIRPFRPGVSVDKNEDEGAGFLLLTDNLRDDND